MSTPNRWTHYNIGAFITTHYDRAKGRWKPGWSSERVADILGIRLGRVVYMLGQFQDQPEVVVDGPTAARPNGNAAQSQQGPHDRP